MVLLDPIPMPNFAISTGTPPERDTIFYSSQSNSVKETRQLKIKVSVFISGFGLLGAALSSPTPTQPERLPARHLLIVPSKVTSDSQLESIAGISSFAELIP
jgi:hypothetical protein